MFCIILSFCLYWKLLFCFVGSDDRYLEWNCFLVEMDIVNGLYFILVKGKLFSLFIFKLKLFVSEEKYWKVICWLESGGVIFIFDGEVFKC